MKLGSFKTLFTKPGDTMKENSNGFIHQFSDEVNRKITTPAKAFEAIKSGDRIFVGTACATPKALIAELEEQGTRLNDVQMISVTQAFAIDLMGQVCADQFDGEFYGGVSTQPDFIRGTAATLDGKPIVCLPATTEDGKRSRIRPLLLEGEGVTIARSDIHYVITEYGSAYIYAKSIKERALSLIEIAHPDFREDLLTEAKRLGYVRKDQTLKSKTGYPIKEEREVTLKSRERLLLRPSKASDVKGLQDLFYNLRPQDIYTRFFTKLASLSEDRAQHMCNVDYENEMAFVAVVGERENETIIGTSCYYKDPSDNLGEVGYMIRPEWQGKGVGTVLQQRMTEHAKERGVNGFKADILVENKKMSSLFQKGVNIKVHLCDDVQEIVATF